MQSKRKRAAGHHEETAAELLQAYHDERPVSRGGNHTMLRWLVLANTYEALDSAPPCPMDRANAMPFVPTRGALEEMEQVVATRVMAEYHDRAYLEYAAYFFRWWAKIAEITATRSISAPTRECEWLSAHNLERSLVVPDVRRGALRIAHRLYVRAGEAQVGCAHLGGARSSSATLQGLRTGEWYRKLHDVLMYGTLTEIHNKGWLAPIYLAIIDGRYLGRLGFEWLDMVFVAPSDSTGAPRPWPRIYAHGSAYIVHSPGAHTICSSIPQAYTRWKDICIESGGVIGGRYDVRKCTI